MKSVCDVVVEEERDEDLDEDLCTVDDLNQLPANRISSKTTSTMAANPASFEEGKDDIVGVRVLPSRHFPTARSIPPGKKVRRERVRYDVISRML